MFTLLAATAVVCFVLTLAGWIADRPTGKEYDRD